MDERDQRAVRQDVAGPAGGPSPTSEPNGLRVVEFQQFDTSFAVPPGDEERERRRLMTLLVSCAPPAHRLSQSEVARAANTEGETFALKRLRPLPSDVEPTSRRGREAALFEEYRNLLAVSHLRGFPSVLGYGVTREGEPAILMEWIDGLTLHEALGRRLLPPAQDGSGGTDGMAVASLALSVLRALVSTTYLDGTFVHRDISPRNIMLRALQGESGAARWDAGTPLDCCLIDLGSAVFMRHDEATFTMTMDVWRNATPEYAPPEMLALSDRGYLEARRSPAIDVYALCSVLYEAYSGHTPFRLADHPGEAAFDLKAAGMPDAPALHAQRDLGLVQAIMSGLQPDQADRPTALKLFDDVAAWRMRETGHAASHPIPVLRSRARGAHLTIAGPPSTWETTLARQEGTAGAGTTASGVAPSAGQAGGRGTTRRSFLIGVACVAAAAGGVEWWLSRTDEGRARTFSRRSWDDLGSLASRLSASGSREDALALAVREGIAHEDGSMVPNLTQVVSLEDGATATVQLVDFCHDDYADGSGKAGLTFAFVTPVAARPMSGVTMLSGGWEECGMRAWMNGYLRSQLPSLLRVLITPVVKLTNNAGATRDAGSVTATEDALWLPSMKELGGDFAASGFNADYQYLKDILNAEGDQYRLWQDQLITPKGDNTPLQKRWQGSPCYWWNRSPSPDCSEDHGETWFNRVGPNGDAFHFACPSTGDEAVTTVLPCFCL